MRTLFATFALLLAMPLATFAQTPVTVGPVNTSMKFGWSLPSNVTVAQAPTFETRLRVDGTPATALTGVTCATATSCQSNLTQSNADALNQVGSHNITLSLFRADVGDSAPSAPFVLKSPAGAPTAVSIIP